MGIMGIVGVMGDGTFGRKWGRKIDGSKKAFRTFLLPVLMEFAWSAGGSGGFYLLRCHVCVMLLSPFTGMGAPVLASLAVSTYLRVIEE